MELRKRIEGDVAVLTLAGKVMGGPEPMEKYKGELNTLADEGIKKVVLDLSGGAVSTSCCSTDSRWRT